MGRASDPGGRLQTGRTGIPAGRDPSPARWLPTAEQLTDIYRALLDAYGPQQWWPTASEDPEEERFEICLGAILTQNTWWVSAAAALSNLRAARVMSPEAILDLPQDVLADLIRPSGHFNVKARKLRAFCEVVVSQGGGSVDALLQGEADEVRERLLEVWGIGPETADAMTLYAARKPTFVVDAYAYRIFERLGCPPGPRKYDAYRDFMLDRIERDESVLNEWHALLVRHGQRTCAKTNPQCGDCPLLAWCDFGQGEVGEVWRLDSRR